ncbi:MAG TPA: hypothetical protein QGH16_03010, partial [Verrucomicrobiota bacterium]|nr:hypothetical protein [Verrucomicrobiota bacterium]
VSGTQTAGDGLTDGSVTLEGLDAGDHVAIFFENDGYTQLAKTSFSVVSEDGIYYAENFDSLELGPFVSDSESNGDGTDWTATAPEGWLVAFGDDHGPTVDGDDVVEFDGWTFLDPVSWNATAGQERAQFTKGTGVIAVGDSDEYDDKVSAKFNSSLSTPAIDISGAAANSLELTYDSSWRAEPQQGKVLVSFDGGEAVTLLELSPDSPTAYNETVSLNLNNPAGANTAVVTWDHQGKNNWWWAIDNIMVTGESGSDEPATPTTILVDFGGAGEFGSGASPDPWITIDNLVMDQAASLGGGVTITALDDGFNPNNTASPGTGAEYDGVSVSQEARNDYLFKIADAAGTTARMRIDGLAAGTYNVTVFEGRTTDASQFAKIWTGEEPAAENTGDFAKGSATVTVTVGAGESLWYKHLEDGNGGVSGMMIRPAAETPALSIANNGDGTVTVTFEGKLQAATSVNGPWQDATELVTGWDGTSPLTLTADQAILFGRAVK